MLEIKVNIITSFSQIFIIAGVFIASKDKFHISMSLCWSDEGTHYHMLHSKTFSLEKRKQTNKQKTTEKKE